MATLDEAENARNQHAEGLRKMGAHGIEVREGKKGDFAVIAQFKKVPRGVPESLDITHRGVAKRVPLKAEVREEYRPEAKAE
ncbi:MAG TPA: hypothetical protein DCK98_11530 [Chloroflexi bacterium]|nr:hypothetical protein [Chloroflexota bacterium]HAL28143.1 hypothetical protein [Chloroflexota bacterium]